MSSKSKSVKTHRRPIDPELWNKAASIAALYRVVIWFEDGEYNGHGVELPTTFSDGSTPDECMTNVREAMTLTVLSMLEDGEIPPAPAVYGKTTQQVNIRLSDEERLILESVAKSHGFTEVADYLRAARSAGGGHADAGAK